MASCMKSICVKRITVKEWKRKYDPENRWLYYELDNDNSNLVKLVFCRLCRKHQNRVNHLRNFSRAFCYGISGTALTSDNVRKHSICEPHIRCKQIDARSLVPTQFSPNNNHEPILKAFGIAKQIERERVGKLFDVAYTLASEEIPFSNFESIANLEIKHDVDQGNSYLNQLKCQEFSNIIGEIIKVHIISKIKDSEYFSILMDGCTDVSSTEKEALFILSVNSKGQVENNFVKLKDAKVVTSVGLKECLFEALFELGIEHVDEHIVGFMADGASVNLGTKSGLGVLLKNEFNWLIVIHCLNHRLELAAKDAFNYTEFQELLTLLSSLRSLYNHSPKRYRELKQLGDITDEIVSKPEKATGTCWIQHKRSACNSLLKSYPVIVCHLENLVSDDSVKKDDKPKIQGYLRKLKSFKTVINLLFFSQLLEPLAKLSLSLQDSGIDLIYAMSCLDHLYTTLKTAELIPEILSLLTQAKSGHDEDIKFKNVSLTYKQADAEKFEKDRGQIYCSIEKFLHERFSDLTNKPVFQFLKLINLSLWPKTKSDLLSYAMMKSQIF